jgi:hypothetical protein
MSKESVLVDTIVSVNASWLAMNKVSIIINATGTATTKGWTNPQLIPVVYVDKPADRIWEFSFVADGPGGHLDVITELKAFYQWKNPPGDIKGVRVKSSTNTMESTVSSLLSD